MRLGLKAIRGHQGNARKEGESTTRRSSLWSTIGAYENYAKSFGNVVPFSQLEKVPDELIRA
jgi:hypothetical protein